MNTRRMRSIWAGVVGILAAVFLPAQQMPDREFQPPVPRPAFAEGRGPRLAVDEAHHNFHTLGNRFWAFGELARRDGYRVAPLRSAFSAAVLGEVDLLVIANAQWSELPWSEYPAPTPSAFTESEIAAVREWVERGGRLLLIADHMPLAGAAAGLASAFDASFTDGFAFKSAAAGATPAEEQAARAEPTLFRPEDGTLAAHPITRGRDVTEQITQVRSFTGQAFQMTGAGVRPVLVLPPDFVSLEPRIAWQFDASTKRRPVGGWLQGATREVGRGRVAIFGEAGLFTAQVSGKERRPMGMNAPLAGQNAQFVLNTLHWLSGVIEPGRPPP